MYYAAVALALILPFFTLASPLPWDGAPSCVTRLRYPFRFGEYLRVYLNRYSGSSGNVNGGSTTGGGGIDLIKILTHNGTPGVVLRPVSS